MFPRASKVLEAEGVKELLTWKQFGHFEFSTQVDYVSSTVLPVSTASWNVTGGSPIETGTT